MHVPLWGVCIHPEHWLKLFCPTVKRKVHVLCWVHKWWHVLASCFLLSAEMENIRGLDREGRKMQDTECPINSSNTQLLTRNFSATFQCMPLCAFTAGTPPQKQVTHLRTGLTPRWTSLWNVLLTAIGITISRDVHTGPRVHSEPRALKWSRRSEERSAQPWALFTARKCNTGNNNLSFCSPRPVKKTYLRISPTFCHTWENGKESRNVFLYTGLCSSTSVFNKEHFEQGGKSRLK